MDRKAQLIPWVTPDLSWAGTGRDFRPPQFPIDVFTSAYQSYIRLTAECTNTPVDWAGSLIFPVTSAAVGNTRRVQAHQGWSEPLIFWVMIKGFSGDGKSPLFIKMVNRLEEIEDRLIAAWRAKKKAIDDENVARKKNEQPLIPVPPEPMIVAQDATAEKLVMMLDGNPRGGLAHQDEIMGMLNGMDRYHNKQSSGDQQFWLQAFNGGRWKRSRIRQEDGSVIVNLWFSMMGGIQPEVFATLLTRPNDGFLARFLYSYPLSLPPSWPKEFPDDAFIKSVLGNLRTLDFATGNEDGNPCRPQPINMTLTPNAVERFKAWRQTRYARQQMTGGLFQTWLGKADGYVLRFAGMLANLDWAARPAASAFPLVVTDGEINRGITLFDEYYAPMALGAFGDAALSPEEYGARLIARNIINGSHIVTTREDGRTVVSVDKIRRAKILHTLKTAEAVRSSLKVLQQRAGWVRKAPPFRDASGPGRERDDWEINPGVLQGVDDRDAINVAQDTEEVDLAMGTNQ